MKYLIKLIFLFFCSNFIFNCAGSPSSTAASSSKAAPAYIIAGSNSGVAYVSRISARAGVIVSGPLAGALAFFP